MLSAPLPGPARLALDLPLHHRAVRLGIVLVPVRRHARIKGLVFAEGPGFEVRCQALKILLEVHGSRARRHRSTPRYGTATYSGIGSPAPPRPVHRRETRGPA